MDYIKEYEKWLENADAETAAELKKMNDSEKRTRFTAALSLARADCAELWAQALTE